MPGLDERAYLDATTLCSSCRDARMALWQEGGQELILAEVIAALAPCDSVWLPFAQLCRSLDATLVRLGIKVRRAAWYSYPEEPCEAAYFGSPTIVDGRPLFPHLDFVSWDADAEREAVRRVVVSCRKQGIDRIVSGLGSGDVSVPERMADMGGGEVLCMKRFEDFTDHVLVAI